MKETNAVTLEESGRRKARPEDVSQLRGGLQVGFEGFHSDQYSGIAGKLGNILQADGSLDAVGLTSFTGGDSRGFRLSTLGN